MNIGGKLILPLRRAASLLWVAEARLRGVRVGRNVRFYGRPVITREAGSTLSLGDGVVLNSSLRANPLGNAQPCVVRTLAADAHLTLGRGVGVSGSTIVAAKTVVIGEGTQIGVGCLVMDTDIHERVPGTGEIASSFCPNAKPVRVGRHVFIGARCIILKGVTIGDCATVGAGSVVTKDVDAGSIVAGNPARKLRNCEK